jgi:hypothetical protein
MRMLKNVGEMCIYICNNRVYQKKIKDIKENKERLCIV